MNHMRTIIISSEDSSRRCMSKQERLGPYPKVHLAPLEEHWICHILLRDAVTPRRFPEAGDQRGRGGEARVHASRALSQLDHPVIVLAPTLRPLQITYFFYLLRLKQPYIAESSNASDGCSRIYSAGCSSMVGILARAP